MHRQQTASHEDLLYGSTDSYTTTNQQIHYNDTTNNHTHNNGTAIHGSYDHVDVPVRHYSDRDQRHDRDINEDRERMLGVRQLDHIDKQRYKVLA